MNRPTTIIWDWNGTLLDDTWLCFDIANAMLLERGMKTLPDHNAYRDVFCFPIIDYYRRMGYVFDADAEPYEKLSEQYVSCYEQNVTRCALREGMGEILKALQADGRRQILLSATGLYRLLPQVKHYGLEPYFEQVLGLTDDFAHGKAALALDFFARTGLDPQDTIFIGDTHHDFDVAQACGCRCALLTGGHQHRTALESCGVPVFDTFVELGRYLGIALKKPA